MFDALMICGSLLAVVVFGPAMAWLLTIPLQSEEDALQDRDRHLEQMFQAVNEGTSEPAKEHGWEF